MMLHLSVGVLLGGGEQVDHACIYLGPSSRATYYLERDAVTDDWNDWCLLLCEDCR